jgi:hypothetical protein
MQLHSKPKSNIAPKSRFPQSSSTKNSRLSRSQVSEADLHRLCPTCNGDFPRDFVKAAVDAVTFEK